MPRGRPTRNEEGDLCEDCGENEVRFKGYTGAGSPRWDKLCSSCHKGNYGMPWLKHRGDRCEECEHKPLIGKWSLDVHHLDEDKTNNDPDNLMTLCKNCHATIHALTYEYGDRYTALSILRKFIKALLD